jgi:hypothetical protein
MRGTRACGRPRACGLTEAIRPRAGVVGIGLVTPAITNAQAPRTSSIRCPGFRFGSPTAGRRASAVRPIRRPTGTRARRAVPDPARRAPTPGPRPTLRRRTPANCVVPPASELSVTAHARRARQPPAASCPRVRGVLLAKTNRRHRATALQTAPFGPADAQSQSPHRGSPAVTKQVCG